MSVPGVRRDKAALSSGCKPHPATATKNGSGRAGTSCPFYSRYSFIVMDLHHLLLAGLPAHSALPRKPTFVVKGIMAHVEGSGTAACDDAKICCVASTLVAQPKDCRTSSCVRFSRPGMIRCSPAYP